MATAQAKSAVCNAMFLFVVYVPLATLRAVPRALVPHLKRMPITQQVKLIALTPEDLVYAVDTCTASVEIIGVRASSVVLAVTQNASKTLNEALETRERWPLRLC